MKRRKAVVDHMEVLGEKYANMLWILKHLDSLVTKENISLSPITWTVVPEMLCIFLNKACAKQYTCSTESFRPRFNIYKSAHRSFIKGITIKHALFHAYFEDDKHHEMGEARSLWGWQTWYERLPSVTKQII